MQLTKAGAIEVPGSRCPNKLNDPTTFKCIAKLVH